MSLKKRVNLNVSIIGRDNYVLLVQNLPKQYCLIKHHRKITFSSGTNINVIYNSKKQHHCVLCYATTQTKFTQHIPVLELCLDMDNSQLGRMMVVS